MDKLNSKVNNTKNVNASITTTTISTIEDDDNVDHANMSKLSRRSSHDSVNLIDANAAST